MIHGGPHRHGAPTTSFRPAAASREHRDRVGCRRCASRPHQGVAVIAGRHDVVLDASLKHKGRDKVSFPLEQITDGDPSPPLPWPTLMDRDPSNAARPWAVRRRAVLENVSLEPMSRNMA